MKIVLRARAGIAAAVLLAAVSVAATAAPQETKSESGAPIPGADSQVLNETCYMRTYHQYDWDRFNPALLKDPKDPWIKKNLLAYIERGTKARLAHLKIDWSTTDWRDVCVYRFICSNGGIQETPEMEQYMNAPSPPPDWAKSDFDDSGWPRQRKPFLVGKPQLAYQIINTGVIASFHRLKFVVPDAAVAGDLDLKIGYRGGVRIFVNGQEAGRGHLPAGEIGPKTLATDYPVEAYIRVGDEVAQETRDRAQKFYEGKADRWPAMQMLLPEMFGTPPELKNGLIECHLGTASVTPATWRRIQSLRDRVLEIRVPARLLKPGENVLGIEVRSAPLNPVVLMGWVGWGNYSWPHDQINTLRLAAASGKIPAACRRPAGAQVWVVDPQYRLHDTDWGDLGHVGAIRVVGARNGTYSGQIGIGSDRDLRNLRIAPSELKRDGGGAIPASAVAAVTMQPHKLLELSSLCGGRSKSLSDHPLDGGEFVSLGEFSLRQHGMVDVDRLTREQRLQRMSEVHCLDQIGPGGPKDVAAGACVGAWVSIRIPDEAKPGRYAGAVKVEADGLPPQNVPVEVEVVDWRLPDPRDFRTVMALEQSPYGVAKAYNVKPWSERHVQLLENSFRLLGRAGNQYLFVPVLSWTEFGNRDDSPIKWIRKKDGSFGHDFANLDRYLDLAVKHWGVPKVISFVVMHGNPANPPEVQVFDEATAKTEPMKVGPGLPEADRRRIWGSFGASLFEHMRARGLEKAMFWGYAWDSEGDPMLVPLMAEFTPGVYWSMGGHDVRCDPRIYKAFSWIYKTNGALSIGDNRMGWRNPKLEFQNPRGGGCVLSLPGASPAFGFRLAVDRALTAGCRGLGRLGADYWKDAFYDGARGGEGYLQPGMETHILFWPGPDGADSSGRYEALIEGIEEDQARIFLEQALVRKSLPADLEVKVLAVVNGHIRATTFIPAGTPVTAQLEYGIIGWQERSRKLYRMAADAAAVIGMDVDEGALAVDVPARARRSVNVKIRNWTAAPRAWKASADVPWLALDKTQGSVAKTETLAISIDSDRMEPDKTARGIVTITDTAGGRSYPVEIDAAVSKVFDVSLAQAVFNVAPAQSESRQFAVLNDSGKPWTWKAVSSAPWLQVEPAGGTIAPGETKLVTLSAKPADKTAASLEGKVTISGDVGGSREVAVKAFVVPPYRPPAAAPQGEAVPLDRVDKARLVRNDIVIHTEAGWMRDNEKNKPHIAPDMYFGWDIGSASLKGFKKSYEQALWVRPQSETIYKLDGSGFKAFAAEVGLPKGLNHPQLYRDARVNFEIWVDGKMAVQSDFMTVADEPRLLVADGLATAKEIMLVARLDNLKDSLRCLAFWADPKFYK